MKPQLSLSAWALILILIPSAAAAQGPRLQLDGLNSLAEKAEHIVDVSVDAPMLRQTIAFLSASDPNAAKLRAAIEGITGIYVKGFEFSAENAYTTADVEAIRKQVTDPRWSRIVSVREKNELTEIYFWREREENGGIVVISAEAKELTVVNVVGRIDLAALASLGPIIPKLPGAASKMLKK